MDSKLPGLWWAEVQLAAAGNALWAQSRLPQSTLVSAGLLAGEGRNAMDNRRLWPTILILSKFVHSSFWLVLSKFQAAVEYSMGLEILMAVSSRRQCIAYLRDKKIKRKIALLVWVDRRSQKAQKESWCMLTGRTTLVRGPGRIIACIPVRSCKYQPFPSWVKGDDSYTTHGSMQ